MFAIDSRITALERQLHAYTGFQCSCGSEHRIRVINQKGLYLLDGLIAFKESILKQADQCSLYTANYPLLIQHIIREAKIIPQISM